MKNILTFPYQTKTIENHFIPMPDGARLAARIWMPEGAEAHPFPAIVEYIPYRKRDLTRDRDEANHAYLAGNGYVCVRVDMRGSGDSDGVLTDEYTRQEQEDGVEVIAWIAAQAWCNGNVGMMGISWGGFNSLQIAAHQPPALRAVMAACASDDLYADNMHYMGGCLLGDNLSEATVMFAFNSLPPDPKIVGRRWRTMWHQRLEGSGLWLESWLKHQRRSDYWRNSSVCEDYNAIQCPVMAVGGWADGFTNAVFRLMENLSVPRLGLIGPWGHKYPHHGIPGPPIGFLQELLRWWDYWLKGLDTGIMDEPILRFWMQDSVPPHHSYETRPGWWTAEDTWPSSTVSPTRYPLCHPGTIGAPETHSETKEWMSLQSPLTLGMAAGKWCSYAATPDLPGDQRREDGGALTFDTEPLDSPMEILGMGWAELELTADRPTGMVCVRVSDVSPSGKATRITYGLLNLTHRVSDESPSLLEPGKPYSVRVYLNGIGQCFPTGHRIRVSISTSYWPLAWTPPEHTMIRVNTANSYLVLPQRRNKNQSVTTFAGPEQAPEPDIVPLAPGEVNWRLVEDLAADTFTLEVTDDRGAYLISQTDTQITRASKEWYSIKRNDINSTRGETWTRRCFKRADWDVEVLTRTVLTSDQTMFYLHAQLDAYEGEERVYSQNWSYDIPRNMA